MVYHNKAYIQGKRIHLFAPSPNDWRTVRNNELANQAFEASKLAKADLLTDMVGEFPELQGIMGRYYAQYEGLSDDIAFAIEDQYKPRFAGDELPRNPVGVCLALADKLETLVITFIIGEVPTGDKDPFALRRHALGVIRTLIEKNLIHFELNQLIDQTYREILSITAIPNPQGVFLKLPPNLEELLLQLKKLSGNVSSVIYENKATRHRKSTPCSV